MNTFRSMYMIPLVFLSCIAMFFSSSMDLPRDPFSLVGQDYSRSMASRSSNLREVLGWLKSSTFPHDALLVRQKIETSLVEAITYEKFKEINEIMQYFPTFYDTLREIIEPHVAEIIIKQLEKKNLDEIIDFINACRHHRISLSTLSGEYHIMILQACMDQKKALEFLELSQLFGIVTLSAEQHQFVTDFAVPFAHQLHKDHLYEALARLLIQCDAYHIDTQKEIVDKVQKTIDEMLNEFLQNDRIILISQLIPFIQKFEIRVPKLLQNKIEDAIKKMISKEAHATMANFEKARSALLPLAIAHSILSEKASGLEGNAGIAAYFGYLKRITSHGMQPQRVRGFSIGEGSGAAAAQTNESDERVSTNFTSAAVPDCRFPSEPSTLTFLLKKSGDAE